MRVVSIIGPSHSGKSTLAQALAGLEGGAISGMDVAGVASASAFSFMGDDWAVLDIAGGADGLPGAGPALAASDAVVICVPAEAEAAVLAAPFMRMVEAADVPAILFINKIDTASDRVAAIVAELQSYASHPIALRQVPIRDADAVVGAVDLISERAWKYAEGKPSSLIELPASIAEREAEARSDLLESLSDFDDTLLEQLIEDRIPSAAEIYKVETAALQHHDLVPAFLGSAEHKNGLVRLMKSLRHEAPGPEALAERLGSEVLAIGCLADQVKHLGKTVLIRSLGDGLAGGAALAGGTIGSITGLDGKTPLKALGAGEIGLTVKTDHLSLGAVYTASAVQPLPDWATAHAPSYVRIVTPAHEKDETRLSSALARLAEIDPAAAIGQDEQTGHARLATQGPQHLKRLTQKLSDGFGVAVATGGVPPALRETIRKSITDHHYRHRKQSGGAGQFADVVIDLRPRPRGAGFAFDDVVKGGAVPKNYIPAVEQGAKEALLDGPYGYCVVDVAVTLKDGKHHAVDSSDFAFRTAGKNAVREAMAAAGGLVLQPIMAVDIHVPSVFSGALVPLVSGLKGQVLGFETNPGAAGWDIFQAHLPMTVLDDLFNALGASTRGTAWFEARFDHYQELRKEELAQMEARVGPT